MAERHYEEGGPELPVHARELYAVRLQPVT